VRRSGNGVGHINNVKLSSLVSTDHLRQVCVSGISRPLSLATPRWVGAASTGDGFGRGWGRNGEFCIAVDPVTRTAGILAYCMLA